MFLLLVVKECSRYFYLNNDINKYKYLYSVEI